MIPGKVNIIIPLFNQEQYVRQCVNSALAQTYENFDVTVVDDGSTDHSMLVVRDLVDNWNSSDRLKLCTPEDGGHWDFDGKLKIIQQGNAGVSEARNNGIRSTDGEFVLPLDADDWLDPDYLKKTVPKMSDSKVGIVSTDMQYEGLLHNRIPAKEMSLEAEMRGNEIPVCSLIRRSAFEQTKGYETIFIEIGGNQRAPGFEDWNLWIDILKREWKMAVVSEPLFHYRIKPISMVTEASKVRAGLTKLIHLLHPDLWRNP